MTKKHSSSVNYYNCTINNNASQCAASVRSGGNGGPGVAWCFVVLAFIGVGIVYFFVALGTGSEVDAGVVVQLGVGLLTVLARLVC